MIIPRDVLQRYSDVKPFVGFVGARVRETVLAFCEEQGFAFVGRHKTAESIAEKIETGRYDGWGQLDDLFACTIVIPTLADEGPVLSFLKGVFEEILTRERGTTQKAPDVFRFDATRFVGRLRRLEGLSGLDHNVAFEVQVRSAFEHAWSVTTHTLVYKAHSIDWRRLRVSAQLRAAVEQLDSLVLAFEESAKHVTEHRWPEVAARMRVAQFFRDHIDQGRIPPELGPKDWTRFADNVYGLLRAALGTGRVERLATRLDEVLPEVDAEVRTLTLLEFPRSLSLFQFVLGVLTQKELIRPPLERNYFPLITPELVALFPAVEGFNQRFDFGT